MYTHVNTHAYITCSEEFLEAEEEDNDSHSSDNNQSSAPAQSSSDEANSSSMHTYANVLSSGNAQTSSNLQAPANEHMSANLQASTNEESSSNVQTSADEQAEPDAEQSLKNSSIPLFDVCSFRRHDKIYKVVQAGCCGGDGVGVGILVVPSDPNSKQKPRCATCQNSRGHCVHTTAFGGEDIYICEFATRVF
jgi:hypothetical protein